MIDTARFIEVLGGYIETFKQLNNGEWVVLGRVPLEPLTQEAIDKELDKAINKCLTSDNAISSEVVENKL
jgi:hypothetical protein